MRPLDCDSFPRKPPNNSLDLAPWNEERRHIRPLELVTHPVHLLHVGEDHFGIYPLLLDHRGHVLRCEEVGYTSKLFSSYKGNFVILQPVPRRVNLEGQAEELRSCLCNWRKVCWRTRLPHSGGHVRDGRGEEDRSQNDLLLRAGGVQDV